MGNVVDDRSLPAAASPMPMLPSAKALKGMQYALPAAPGRKVVGSDGASPRRVVAGVAGAISIRLPLFGDVGTNPPIEMV